jgi:hypothetical protein
VSRVVASATVSPGDSMTIRVAANVGDGTVAETRFGRVTLTPIRMFQR